MVELIGQLLGAQPGARVVLGEHERLTEDEREHRVVLGDEGLDDLVVVQDVVGRRADQQQRAGGDEARRLLIAGLAV